MWNVIKYNLEDIHHVDTAKKSFEWISPFFFFRNFHLSRVEVSLSSFTCLHISHITLSAFLKICTSKIHELIFSEVILLHNNVQHKFLLNSDKHSEIMVSTHVSTYLLMDGSFFHANRLENNKLRRINLFTSRDNDDDFSLATQKGIWENEWVWGGS